MADSQYGDLALESRGFEPRVGEPVEAEWGTLTVPENRRRPDSSPITLAFVRFPARTADPGRPIVFLAGGPGESGIEVAGGSHFPIFMALRDCADVVVLDQRGAGASRPLLRSEEETWRLPLARPAGSDEVLAFALDKSCRYAERLRVEGIDLAGYNTEESADDVDDLRAALGADRIDLLGMSYGTHLAFAVLKKHAARIGRCLLGGAEGPDHTYKYPSTIQRQLERIGDLAREHPAWKDRLPNFVFTVRDVLERLARDPVTVAMRDPLTRDTTNVAVGRFDIEYVTAAGIADTRVIALMPAWFDGMSRGDFSLLAKKPLLARYLFLLKRGLGGNAMSLLMDCASGATRERWERIEREAAQTVLRRTIDFPFPEIGEAWGGPDLGDDYRTPVRADNTVLFLSASFDCRTPLDNVLEIRKGLPNSDHIVVEDAGHMDVFLSCPGVADTMRTFFRGETVDTKPRFAEPRFAFVAPDSS